VCVYNDITAHQLINEFEGRGLRVPEDVSVCGFDDLERFSPRPRRLTTVNIPFERIGEIAAERLLERITGPTAQGVARHVMLPTTLVVSQTTGPPPCR